VYSSLCAFAIKYNGADTLPSAASPFQSFWICHCILFVDVCIVCENKIMMMLMMKFIQIEI